MVSVKRTGSMTQPYSRPRAMPMIDAISGGSQRDMWLLCHGRTEMAGGECRYEISEQGIGGTQNHFLTVAIFRSWRGLGGSAAPGLPGRVEAYTRRGGMSIRLGKDGSPCISDVLFDVRCMATNPFSSSPGSAAFADLVCLQPKDTSRNHVHSGRFFAFVPSSSASTTLHE